MNTSRTLLILAFALGVLFDAVAVPALTPLARAAAELIVARVNGVDIPVDAYVEVASRKAPADGLALSVDEQMELVEGLVDEELLYREALRLGLDQDPKVRKVIINTLLRERVYSQVTNADFTDAELRAYYQAHADDFIVPEKVQIGTLFVAIGDERTDSQAKALANELYRRAQANSDGFKELATTYSQDPYARRGGDVGFVAVEGKPGLDPVIVQTAFALPVGAIAAPIRIQNGYVVVKSINRRERLERTFEQMKGSVLRAAKNERLKGLYEEYTAALRASADIVVFPSVVSSVRIEPRSAPMELAPGMPDEPEAPGEP